MSVVEQLRSQLDRLPGVVQGPSRVGSRSNPAWFVGRREFAHLHAEDRLDLRLPRAIQRTLRGDPRAHARTGSSEWIELEFHTAHDIAHVLGLAREAWDAARSRA